MPLTATDLQNIKALFEQERIYTEAMVDRKFNHEHQRVEAMFERERVYTRQMVQAVVEASAENIKETIAIEFMSFWDHNLEPVLNELLADVAQLKHARLSAAS